MEVKEKTNLETFLERFDESLFKDYNRIKECAYTIWNNPVLQWYTDHGPKHSERILSLLDQLCRGLLYRPDDKAHTQYGLTPEEVFCLLAAAYLHDIGMQDLSGIEPGRPIDQMGKDDWEKVRKEHPQKSHDIIISHAPAADKKSAIDPGINPESDAYSPLALICEGHGSDYFDEVIESCKGTFNIKGKDRKMRVDLLTALLLMADELDLHKTRAVFNPALPLSRVSKLHHYRHHYIEHVTVNSGHNGAPETHRSIEITFRWPEKKSGNVEWQSNLINWIKKKIEREASRTAGILHNGFAGHFSWAKPLLIIKQEAGLSGEKLTMGTAEQYLLAAEMKKVIDWKEITRQLSERFKAKQGGAACLYGSEDQAIDDFITFIGVLFLSIVDFNDPVKPLIQLDFSGFYNFHNIDDVLEEIAGQAGCSFQPGKSASPIETMQHGKDFYLLVLHRLDKAGSKLINAIKERIISACRKDNSKISVIIATENELPGYAGMDEFHLPERFEEKDIYEYFQKSGDAPEFAAAKAQASLELGCLSGNSYPSPLSCIKITHSIGNLIEKQDTASYHGK